MPDTVIQRPIPRRRTGHTTTVTIGQRGDRFDLITNAREDGSLGEVILRWGKPGTTVAGLMEYYSTAISTGLQHGVPLIDFVHQLIDLRFEPLGDTDDPDFPHVRSPFDWLGRRLAADWLSYAERAAEGIYTADELARGKLDTTVADFRAELSAGVGELAGQPA